MSSFTAIADGLLSVGMSAQDLAGGAGGSSPVLPSQFSAGAATSPLAGGAGGSSPRIMKAGKL